MFAVRVFAFIAAVLFGLGAISTMTDDKTALTLGWTSWLMWGLCSLALDFAVQKAVPVRR